MYKIKLILVNLVMLTLLLTSIELLSQEEDKQFWSGLELSLPITKKLEIGAAREIRLNNDYEDVNWHITDFDISYDFNKRFKTSIKYRYKYDNMDNWQHVWYANLYYDRKFWDIKFNYRFRLQKKFRYEINKHDEEERKRDEDYIRNKISLEYDTDMWLTPYISTELFYLYNNEKYTDRFAVVRYYIGLDIDTFKDQKLGIFYMFEEEFNIKNPQLSNVIGLEYSISLPRVF